MNRAVETYLEAGMPLAERTCEGIARNLKRKETDPKDTINIDINAFAYGSPLIRGARQIITGRVGSCIIVAAVARREDGNLGFMSHIWPNAQSSFENAAESMSRVVEMEATEMILFGGNFTERSAQVVGVLKGFLAVEEPPVEVVGCDVLRGFLSGRGLVIGLDTKAEEPFFTPTNWKFVDPIWDADRLFYGGAHVAPIETFLNLMKRE